jgi:hypothetical protein
MIILLILRYNYSGLTYSNSPMRTKFPSFTGRGTFNRFVIFVTGTSKTV